MKTTVSKIDSEIRSRRKYLRNHMMEYDLQGIPLLDVIELMLYYTIPNKDVRPIAQALVNQFGTIDRMVKASSAERLRIPGIGERTNEHFAMLGMLVPYLLRNKMGEYPVFDNKSKLYEFCASLHVMHEYEVMYLLCLNSASRLIKKEVKITVGTPSSANVELKHIMDAVANTATVKVVLCHNHPSGLLKPSTDDIKFTRSVKFALDRININLMDHIIVADNSTISMRELRLIK